MRVLGARLPLLGRDGAGAQHSALSMSEPPSFEPQLDAGAAVVASVILAGALAMRLKIDGAIAAREATEAARVELQAARVGALDGSSGVGVDDVERLDARVRQLELDAERARTISLFGLGLRFMVPLPLGARAPGTQEGEQRGAGRGGGARPELGGAVGSSRWPRGVVLAVLSAVMLMQLGLLALLATDPMAAGPPLS